MFLVLQLIFLVRFIVILVQQRQASFSLFPTSVYSSLIRLNCAAQKSKTNNRTEKKKLNCNEVGKHNALVHTAFNTRLQHGHLFNYVCTVNDTIYTNINRLEHSEFIRPYNFPQTNALNTSKRLFIVFSQRHSRATLILFINSCIQMNSAAVHDEQQLHTHTPSLARLPSKQC